MLQNDSQLSPDRIDIWQFSLATIPPSAKSVLNEEERYRAQRFHFQKHQRRFTVARAMLRAIIGSYLKKKPEEILFTYNNYGKPEVNSDKLQFNLSHSGELALLAIGQDLPIGIDLEFFSARPYEGIGKHLFSPNEIEDWSRQPNPLKPISFFHIWAQKEAFIKASGLGLAYPTQNFSVSALARGDELIFDSLHNHFWKMNTFMPTIGCCAAICFAPIINILQKVTVDPNQIFKGY